jgi:branched-chain amino acid transport system permease protein
MTPAAWIAYAGLAAVFAALPLVAPTYVVSLALSIMMYAGLALSWSMFSGATRYVSLATSAFFGVGAYTCAILLGSWPWPLVVAAGGAIAALLALILGLCVLHLRGTYFAILTFGISELLKNAITYVEKMQFGTVGRLMMNAPPLIVIYWTMLAVAAAAAVTYRLVERSNFGAAMRAIGSDEGRAATLGLDVRTIKILGFALSAVFAGAIGATISVRWTYIDPQVVFNPFIVFQTVLIAMIGGANKLRGPILGAIVFGALEETLRLNFSYYYMIMLGVLLILSVLYIPDGLSSLARPAWLGGVRRAEGGHG